MPLQPASKILDAVAKAAHAVHTRLTTPDAIENHKLVRTNRKGEEGWRFVQQLLTEDGRLIEVTVKTVA